MTKTLILTGIIILIFAAAEPLGFGRFAHPQKWIILSFFVTVSFLFHQLTEQALRKNKEKFVEFYLATVIIRILLSMIFVGIEFYLKVSDKPLFVITFFVLYLCYTIFEITNFSRKLRQN
jgi:hypothetical protein